MILWIASYPKSGNTWVRALISTYLYSKDNKFKFELLNKIPKFLQEKYFLPICNLDEFKKNPLKITEYWQAAQSRINLTNETIFLKTHNACAAHDNNWFAEESNKIGYIYIVRDPRAVACSKAYHTGLSIEKSVASLLNENEIGFNGSYKLAEMPGSWRINYASWKKKKNFNGILVKYEDLVDNTEKEFKKVLVFLKGKMNISIDQEKLSKSVISCQFSNLRKMEDDQGFIEKTNSKFFRKGTKDSWKNDLTENLRKKIEENFKSEMIELGYL